MMKFIEKVRDIFVSIKNDDTDTDYFEEFEKKMNLMGYYVNKHTFEENQQVFYQIHSKKCDKINNENVATGIIMDNNGKIVAYPSLKAEDIIVSKDDNVLVSNKDTIMINNNKLVFDGNMRSNIYEAGTRMIVWYDGTCWHVATSRSPDAFQSKWKRNKSDMSFGEMFEEIVGDLNVFYEGLDDKFSYTFLMTHEKINHVTNGTNKVYLTNVYNTESKQFENSDDDFFKSMFRGKVGYGDIDYEYFSSIYQCKNCIENIKNGLTSGIIMIDTETFKTYKILGEEYNKLFSVRCSSKDEMDEFLSIRQHPEVYQEYRDKYDNIDYNFNLCEGRIKSMIHVLHGIYIDEFVNGNNMKNADNKYAKSIHVFLKFVVHDDYIKRKKELDGGHVFTSEKDILRLFNYNEMYAKAGLVHRQRQLFDDIAKAFQGEI